MKSRLSSTIRTLALANGIVPGGSNRAGVQRRQAIGRRYQFWILRQRCRQCAAGARAVAVALALAMGIILAWRLGRAAGRAGEGACDNFPSGWRWAIRERARTSSATNEFGYIADNLNRARGQGGESREQPGVAATPAAQHHGIADGRSTRWRAAICRSAAK